MMTLMWLIAAMAAAVSYVYWNNQYSAFARTIDLIPGPRKIPLIGSILEFKENHGMYPLNCFILFHKKAPPPPHPSCIRWNTSGDDQSSGMLLEDVWRSH